MKLLLNLLLFILPTIVISAQSNDPIRAIAQKTCDCITVQDYKNMTENDIMFALGLCMLKNSEEYKDQIKDKYGLEFGKDEEAIGEKVGMAMAMICPEVFQVITKSDRMKDELSSSLFTYNSTGVVIAVEQNQFYTIVQDDSKKIQKFLWLTEFYLPYEYTSNPSLLIGKNVTIEHYTQKYFNPTIKEYTNQNVIVNITFN